MKDKRVYKFLGAKQKQGKNDEFRYQKIAPQSYSCIEDLQTYEDAQKMGPGYNLLLLAGMTTGKNGFKHNNAFTCIDLDMCKPNHGLTYEDYKNHPCHRTKCDSCLQRGCPDYIFKHIENPELPCKDCNRKFYGVTCQLNHLTQKANGQSVAPAESNVCQSHKKCPICLHVYTS